MASAESLPTMLTRLVERARRLYSLPTVAREVLELTSKPHLDLLALKTCLERDPALTGRVLRVVNSAFYGLPSQVVDLQQALGLLGVRTIKMLVLGFSLPPQLLAGLDAAVLERFWRRSLIRALLARELGRHVAPRADDEAFVAGLLQGLGELLLLQELGAPYVRFLERLAVHGGDQRTLETAMLGFDHALVSGRVLHDWGLPPHLARSVAANPTADGLAALGPDERTLPLLLHVADLGARLLAEHATGLWPTLMQAARQAWGLDEPTVRSILETLQPAVREFAAAIRLDLPEGEDYAGLIAEAHARLTELTEEPTNAEPDAAHVTSPITAATAEPGLDTSAQVPLSGPESGPAERDADPGLLSCVSAALADSRRLRQPASLLLVELDRFAELLQQRGPDDALRLFDELSAAVDAVAEHRADLVFADDARRAWVWPADRMAGLRFARELQTGVRQWSEQANRGHGSTRPVTCSLGLATAAAATKSVTPERLWDAAERCLSAAQAGGGDGLKSIEIF